MFSHHVFAVMFCRLWCSLSKGLGIFLALLFFFAFGLPQAEGHGVQSAEWSPIQQTPAPHTQPNNHLFLPIIAGGASPLDHDERPSQPSMNVVSSASETSESDTPPPEGNRHTFVTDSGGHLDRMLFRGDLPDGHLKFTIEITSPVVQQSDVTPEGLLTPAAFVEFASRNFMPLQAILTLQVNDVDDDAPDVCPKGIIFVSTDGKFSLPMKLRLPSCAAAMNSGMSGKCLFPSRCSGFPLQGLPVEILSPESMKLQSR